MQGNLVGTNAAGTGTIGNGGDGIRMHNALNTTVGGSAAGANLVTGNDAPGITVFGDARAARDGKPDQQQLGVLEHRTRDRPRPERVTANDAGDADAGANNFQNFPGLTDASTSTAGTVVDGTLGSTPSTTFTLEFFDNNTCDPSGSGEGKTLLGTQVRHDGGRWHDQLQVHHDDVGRRR